MMIFLTVGLHEQPFDRIVQLVDGSDADERLIQSGYGACVPTRSTAKPFMNFDEIRENMSRADVVVTHGGTGSIMMALSAGKAPIVAPRYKRFNEHVDDHQEEIVREMAQRGLIIPFYDGDDFGEALRQALGRSGSVVVASARSIDALIERCLKGTAA